MYCEYVTRHKKGCTAGKAVMPDGKFSATSGAIPYNGGFSLPARDGFPLRRCNSRFSGRCTCPLHHGGLKAAGGRTVCKLFYSDFMTDSSCW